MTRSDALVVALTHSRDRLAVARILDELDQALSVLIDEFGPRAPLGVLDPGDDLQHRLLRVDEVLEGHEDDGHRAGRHGHRGVFEGELAAGVVLDDEAHGARDIAVGTSFARERFEVAADDEVHEVDVAE